MRRIVLALGILCLSLSFPCFAASKHVLHPAVYMLRLKVIKTAEKNGDELYVGVTVYPSKAKPTHTQVPKYPLHWLSKHLDKLKRVKLWDGEVQEGHSVTLILSLIEQDTPPWDTDDLIGSVRIRLKNNRGHLETSWSMPNRVDAPVSVYSKYGRAEKFVLLGEGSNYEMFLALKLQKKKNGAKH